MGEPLSYSVQEWKCGCGDVHGWYVERSDGERTRRNFQHRRQADLLAELLAAGRLTWDEADVLLCGPPLPELLAGLPTAAPISPEVAAAWRRSLFPEVAP